MMWKGRLLLLRAMGVALVLGAIGSMLVGSPEDYVLFLAYGMALLSLSPPLPEGRELPGALRLLAWLLFVLGSIALATSLWSDVMTQAGP